MKEKLFSLFSNIFHDIVFYGISYNFTAWLILFSFWCVSSVSCLIRSSKIPSWSINSSFSSWKKLCRAKHEIIASERFYIWLSNLFKRHLQRALRRPKTLSEDTLADESFFINFLSARVKFGQYAYSFIVHVERGWAPSPSNTGLIVTLLT